MQNNLIEILSEAINEIENSEQNMSKSIDEAKYYAEESRKVAEIAHSKASKNVSTNQDEDVAER